MISDRYTLRRWSVRHAFALQLFYRAFERLLIRLDGLFRRAGYGRLERPAAALERAMKGVLFDCRMCGQCILSSTGMSCPMTCPKQLRNGPCGGVRPDGTCEVRPAMRCAWVAAHEGALRMKGADGLRQRQPALDHRLSGRSSWLAVARERPRA